jgi:Ca2+-binding RTX toxin-like protein
MDRMKRLAVSVSLGLLGAMLLGLEGAQAAPTCFGRRADIVGTGGRDRIRGTPRNDVIVALGGRDVVLGGGGRDLICAGSGDDAVGGHGASDKVAGGSGNDQLFGGSRGDLLKGGGGRFDFLFGQTGNDRLIGGAGGDVLLGQKGNDLFSGGPGLDLASFFLSNSGATANLTLTGPQPTGEGVDRLRSIEGLEGTRSPDIFTGNAQSNFFYLYQGADVANGGGNFDFVSFFLSNNPVTVDLPSDTATGEGNDSIPSIEDAEGSDNGDSITGDDGSNFLFGLAGADNIVAGAEDDLLSGGNGFDTGDGGTEGSEGDLCVSIEDETDCEQSSSAAARVRGPAARAGALLSRPTPVSQLDRQM